MSADDSPLLSLHFRLSSAAGELRVEPSHPLFAAFRRGIEEGQLTGTWRFLLATETGVPSPAVIGTFVKTPKDRLLYFPGAQLEIAAATQTDRFNDLPLDHLTLDPPNGDRYSSHVAVRRLPPDKTRGLSYTAQVRPGFLFPWFSLLVPDLTGFAALPSRLYVEFPSPRRDLQRYGERLMASGGMIILRLPPQPPSAAYLQFDVWVGHDLDWRTRQARVLPWAYKPAIVTNPPKQQDVECSIAEAEFTTAVGVRVVASRPRGQLRAPRILRPMYELNSVPRRRP